jgi:hypothetical protein
MKASGKIGSNVEKRFETDIYIYIYIYKDRYKVIRNSEEPAASVFKTKAFPS